MITLQLEFEIAPPAMDTVEPDPEEPAAPGDPAYLKAGLLGLAEIRELEADGWGFADGGTQMAGCWAIWSQRGDELKLRFLADPEKYPEAWE